MSASLGPVSAALEADLRNWVRRHGVVVWLDGDRQYSGFVDRIAALSGEERPPYEVRAFRGSHLELILALETLASGVEKTPLVVHLPGFNEESVRKTPLLELYLAGVRYRKRLDTLVTEAAAGRVRPEQIEAFKQQESLSLDGADAWLAAVLDEREGGLAAQLRAMQPAAVLDDLLSAGYVAGRVVASVDDQDALWDQLETWTGLPGRWRDATLPASSPRAEDIAFTAASWALCVEYVDDLRREPIDAKLTGLKELPRAVLDTSRGLAAHLRVRHTPFYQRTADETETRLIDEVEAARAEDLGKIDTFRFEEEKILAAALQCLGDGRWDSALEWAALRLDGGSFWLGIDASRRSAWELVRDAAELGTAIGRAGAVLGAKDDLDEAVARYVASGAGVDRAHRRLEQRRTALLYPQLPEFEVLRARLDGLRVRWREWADSWALDFTTLCKKSGFLPAAGMQQRTIFEEVVRPMTQEKGITALFVVDALRFEMGQELFEALADTPATAIYLKPRLAELPTVTEVGMNVLAPVADRGRLQVAMGGKAIKGFSTGEFRVTDPETRRRAMHDRVGGDTCPWLRLDEVVARDATSLKQAVARARLVVVHSQEIDNAGEKGVGPAVFGHVMQKIRAAWRLLRDAGVHRFVITSDHGFLLLDETAGSAQAHGRKIDPKRRHVVSSVAADHTGEARVALADLGYDGTDAQLMFPETTAVFDTGHRAMSFVHGGNSLQERVIPVLTLSHKGSAGSSSLSYAVQGVARDGVAGMHCLEGTVGIGVQGSLDFGSTRDVELALRALEAADVQVELCQTRGGARIAAGSLIAKVGEKFELFFRLTGSTDARVQVQLYHPSAEVELTPCVVDGRFVVIAARGGSVPATAELPPAIGRDWLEDLPSAGYRQLFGHLAAHGAVTETEVAAMLGSQRAARRFAVQFETMAAKAPFSVRIDVVAGVKRYVKE